MVAALWHTYLSGNHDSVNVGVGFVRVRTYLHRTRCGRNTSCKREREREQERANVSIERCSVPTGAAPEHVPTSSLQALLKSRVSLPCTVAISSTASTDSPMSVRAFNSICVSELLNASEPSSGTGSRERETRTAANVHDGECGGRECVGVVAELRQCSACYQHIAHLRLYELVHPSPRSMNVSSRFQACVPEPCLKATTETKRASSSRSSSSSSSFVPVVASVCFDT